MGATRRDIVKPILIGLITMKQTLIILVWICCAAAEDGLIPLKVAAVQFRSSPRVAENATRIGETLVRLAEEGVRVAVFPEWALTSHLRESFPAVNPEEVAEAEKQIRGVCSQKKIAAVFGSVYKFNGKLYNTAIVIDSKGQLVERYGKVYLADEPWFTPGNHISFFDLEGIPSTVLICHDSRYPELVRLPAIQGARMVYYISHESSIRLESKLAPYRAQVMARAVENKVFVVSANAPANPKDLSGSHGQSRIVNDDGTVIREASFFGEDILVETLSVKPSRLERPLHELMGDWWRRGVEFMINNRGRSLE
jgi:predicted amidohydrolase